MPDPFQGVLPHVRELERRDAARGVARPHLACRSHGHVGARPPAHAGLGILLVVVRQDPDDLELRAQPGPLFLHHPPPLVELRPGGHQRVAVVKRPAVELRVRELDALGAERFREPDEVAHLVEVLAVQHNVDREREPELPGPAVRGELIAVGRGAGDVVRELFVRRLDADLDVVEPRTPQRGEAVLRHAVGRRDERLVEPDLVRRRDELFEIGAQQRLAPREAELEYAQRLRLAEHAAPVLGAELVAKPAPGELQRVRAVGTLERTAVGQLGEEPERLRRHGVESNPPGIPKTTSPFAASASRNPATSCWTPSTP